MSIDLIKMRLEAGCHGARFELLLTGFPHLRQE